MPSLRTRLARFWKDWMMQMNRIVALALLALSGCAAPQPIAPPPAAMVASADTIDRLRAQLAAPDETVMVVAHRGCHAGGAPENSLAAIRACLELGVDVIEIDVALSAEGVPVLMHDATLDRMTAETGPIADHTAAELAGLHLRAGQGGAGAALTDETLPTLQQALELAKGRMLVNLDVKGDTYAAAFAMVDELGMGRQIIMKMAADADDPALQEAAFLGKTFFMPIIRQCTENTRKGSCAPTLSQAVAGYDRYGPVAYEVTFVELAYLTEGIPAMQEKGKRIWANTLKPFHAAGLTDAKALADPDAVWGLLIDDGVRMIQTDNPAELIAYLRARGMR